MAFKGFYQDTSIFSENGVAHSAQNLMVRHSRAKSINVHCSDQNQSNYINIFQHSFAIEKNSFNNKWYYIRWFKEEEFLGDSHETGANSQHENKHAKKNMNLQIHCTETIRQLGKQEAHKTKQKLRRERKLIDNQIKPGSIQRILVSKVCAYIRTSITHQKFPWN